MAGTTVTVTDLVTTTITATSSPSSTFRAPPQGGVLEGANPSVYNYQNPIIIFIIQAGIIILFCRLLHWPLSKLRQPRVIAEVIGGVLLGPSVMGRVPGFQEAIFPAASMPNLTLVANLGLILFLFLVGLEADFRFLISNWRVAVSVGFAGMALPFGLGAALALGLYKDFKDEPNTVSISFGIYMLFIGVAMAITAFPVLCRILTELKLLSTPVGIIVLSAGVANDVVGWILLALCVTLVNSGSGLTALWILLTAIGYILFLTLIVRPLFMRLLRKTRALQDGPSQSIIALTLLIALVSAFFTGIIGIHPIFGAFLAGLICPHDGGFAIKVTEKIEDLVSALFLPLYFALSGLSTNLGLLDNGITWAYVIGIIAVAFIAKISGGSGAARLNGLVWRECFTIGALMSCKGLVELIVLNVGLQAKILSTRTFTMFVVMALVTTFATTPLVAALYPPWYQRKLEAWKRGEIDWDTGKSLKEDGEHEDKGVDPLGKPDSYLQSVLIYLRLDTMPSLLGLVSLLETPHHLLASHQETQTPSDAKLPIRGIEVHGLRLLELTERVSSVMKVSEVDERSLYDPVVNTFRTFGRLQNIAVSGEIAIVPQNSFSDTLVTMASEMSSDLLILPWSETGNLSEFQVVSSSSIGEKLESSPYTEFIRAALETSVCNTAVFINNGFGGAARPSRTLSRTFSGFSVRANQDRPFIPLNNRSHHIFFPYIGSDDDKVALRFVLQLARHSDVTAKLIRFESNVSTSGAIQPGSDQGVEQNEDYAAFFDSVCTSLPNTLKTRVEYETLQCSHLAESIVDHATRQVATHGKNAGDLVVVGRNSFLDTKSCLGQIGGAMVEGKIDGSSLLVIQAAGVHTHTF